MGPSWLAAGLLVFAVIFTFELVDRTNFAVIGLASRHSHRLVWVGASLAFVVSSFISVAIGEAVTALLPAYIPEVRVVGGIVLVAFGARELWRQHRAAGPEPVSGTGAPVLPRRVVTTTFTLVLFLEMGDNTQVLTILLVNAYGPWVVLVASMLALVSVAAIGASGGRFLKSRVAPERLERVLAFLLVGIGLLTIMLGLDPSLLPWG